MPDFWAINRIKRTWKTTRLSDKHDIGGINSHWKVGKVGKWHRESQKAISKRNIILHIHNWLHIHVWIIKTELLIKIHYFKKKATEHRATYSVCKLPTVTEQTSYVQTPFQYDGSTACTMWNLNSREIGLTSIIFFYKIGFDFWGEGWVNFFELVSWW